MIDLGTMIDDSTPLAASFLIATSKFKTSEAIKFGQFVFVLELGNASPTAPKMDRENLT